MNRSAGKSANFASVDHQVWCRLFRRFYPVKTAECVAADLGAPVRTVENWMSGVSAPSLGWFVKILDVFGPGVLAEVMPGPCEWLSAAVRVERRAQLEAEQRRIEREMASLDGVHP